MFKLTSGYGHITHAKVIAADTHMKEGQWSGHVLVVWGETRYSTCLVEPTDDDLWLIRDSGHWYDGLVDAITDYDVRRASRLGGNLLKQGWRETRTPVTGHRVLDRLTTSQAAQMTGMTPQQIRNLSSDAHRRHGVELQLPREQWPDARTPLYDAEALRSYLAER